MVVNTPDPPPRRALAMQLPEQPASRKGRGDDVIVRLEKRLQEGGLEDNRKTQNQKNSRATSRRLYA